MPRFFVEDIQPLTVITGDDAKHIAKSLRMVAGEEITLCDGLGNEAAGVINSLSPDAVSVNVLEKSPCLAEPKTRLSLYLAMAKSDKGELVVQKAVELGAFEIVFFISSRCISRPKGNDSDKKILRLQKIANEAAKQCGRGILPQVRGIFTFTQALEDANNKAAFLLYEGECSPLRSQLPQASEHIALFVGSEGGFSPEEVTQAINQGIAPASLGKRILRCETAPIAATSAIMFALGEMD